MRTEQNQVAIPWYLGQAFLWALRLTCIFNYPLFNIIVDGPTANNFLNMPMQVAYLLSVSLLGIFAFLSKRVANALPIKTIALVACLGVVSAGIGTYAPPGMSFAPLIIGGALIGIADAFFSLMWGRYFVCGELEQARKQMPVCLALGVILYFLGVFLPQPVGLVLFFLYPLASAFMLRKGLEPRNRQEPSASREAAQSALSKLWSPLLCVMVCSLVFGLIGQVALTAPVEQGAEHTIPPMGIAGAGFLSCLFAFVIRKKPAFDTVYQVIFVVCSVGLLLLPFLSENYAVLFNLFVICAFYLMEIYYFYFAVEVAQKSKVPTYTIYGVSHGLLCAMTLLGIFLSISVFARSEYGTVQLVLIAFVSAYLLGMGLLIIIRRSSNAKAAARREKQAEEGEAPVLQKKEENTLERYAQDVRLSARETEVFALLIRGRTAAVIAETMCVSNNTVKGHIQNIYRKCDVHNRQDLINKYEEWGQKLS